MKESIQLSIRKNNDEEADLTFDAVVAKLCNISEISYTENKLENAISFVVKTTEFYIPMTQSFDVAAELQKMEDELAYTTGFMAIVRKKLSNEKFVNGAPAAVVDTERKKLADAEARIIVLEEQIASLRK
jgi:valyl-tRNA synthetase